MSPEGNKAIYHRWIEEIWNQANLAAADELQAADSLDHSGLMGVPPTRDRAWLEIPDRIRYTVV